MDKVTLPQVGDVIRSIRFVYGEKDLFGRNSRIKVGRNEPQCIVRRHLTEEEVADVFLKTKKMPKGDELWFNVDYGSVDLSRSKAEYVVIEAQMQGGGTGHGPHDVYPDGWHVVAKRLDAGRKWNPDGEEIEFYMTGCFINMIPPERAIIVGQMEVSFT